MIFRCPLFSVFPLFFYSSFLVRGGRIIKERRGDHAKKGGKNCATVIFAWFGFLLSFFFFSKTILLNDER